MTLYVHEWKDKVGRKHVIETRTWPNGTFVCKKLVDGVEDGQEVQVTAAPRINGKQDDIVILDAFVRFRSQVRQVALMGDGGRGVEVLLAPILKSMDEFLMAYGR